MGGEQLQQLKAICSSAQAFDSKTESSRLKERRSVCFFQFVARSIAHLSETPRRLGHPCVLHPFPSFSSFCHPFSLRRSMPSAVNAFGGQCLRLRQAQLGQLEQQLQEKASAGHLQQPGCPATEAKTKGSNQPRHPNKHSNCEVWSKRPACFFWGY